MTRIETKLADWKRDWRMLRLNRQITNKAHPKPENPTVAIFSASTRLTGISLNAAFAYLAACGLQLADIPVVYFACRAGMSRCVLGTNWQNPSQPPPCPACIAQSRRLFAHAPTVDFTFQEDGALRRSIDDLSVPDLSAFVYPAVQGFGIDQDIPLGDLVLPSLRWANRLHNLHDDEPTRFLFREYILSAWRVAIEFANFLEQANPQILVVFNGVLYPEAMVRWIAQQRGLRVITHEVGFRPFSAFFSDQQATAYHVDIPDEYVLTPEQNASLDEYLGRRFQGEFSMAGIRFWPEMRKMDEDLIRKSDNFQQIVPIFTNVIFDTSQIHANTVFKDMFDWLDLILEIIKSHPETLFVIRAHPDELRPGKQSRESVPNWVIQNKVDSLNNVVFIDPTESLSSYELLERSKFVMLYNSSIGLEAALMGKAVLCGGRARYTPYNTVYFPDSPEEYQLKAEDFLSTGNRIEIPAETIVNARRFMYFQLFKASIPFDEFLEEDTKPGYVRLKPVNWRQLKPENSQVMRTLVDGIVHAKPFLIGVDE
ncbi:MAG: hypothetical protein ABUK20_04160 [Anaerolineales bacterium]